MSKIDVKIEKYLKYGYICWYMGRPKQIYFDDEIIERLEKLGNMSKIVNQALKRHFDEVDGIGLSKKEIEKKIKLYDLELEYIQRKKEIENGKWGRNKETKRTVRK